MDRVFHVAGITSMRPADRERVFEVNVGGTRNVLEEARSAGVQRVVHTSSVGAIGPAKPNESEYIAYLGWATIAMITGLMP